jgi:transcriptional regulator with XRE-family HTH domain
MQFHEYLKTCRENNHLTQEELVHALYQHDTEHFSALDAGTLGKWERKVTKPKAAKQVSIIKYFQQSTGSVLPCLEEYSPDEAVGLICKAGMNNLIGKSKKHIYTYPSETMSVEDIQIYPLRTFERMDALIDMHMPLHQDINHPYLHISREQFKTWALHPDSLFLACEYKDTFIGLSFTIKIKPEVFKKILNFDMRRDEITTDDFASHDEKGCSLMLGFFAINDKIATLIFIRYYAYLIANQNTILHIGAVSNSNEAISLISNMNLKFTGSKITDDGTKIKAYQESLSNTLASEYVVKMILGSQPCPEE